MIGTISVGNIHFKTMICSSTVFTGFSRDGLSNLIIFVQIIDLLTSLMILKELRLCITLYD